MGEKCWGRNENGHDIKSWRFRCLCDKKLEYHDMSTEFPPNSGNVCNMDCTVRLPQFTPEKRVRVKEPRGFRRREMSTVPSTNEADVVMIEDEEELRDTVRTAVASESAGEAREAAAPYPTGSTSVGTGSGPASGPAARARLRATAKVASKPSKEIPLPPSGFKVFDPKQPFRGDCGPMLFTE